MAWREPHCQCFRWSQQFNYNILDCRKLVLMSADGKINRQQNSVQSDGDQERGGYTPKFSVRFHFGGRPLIACGRIAQRALPRTFLFRVAGTVNVP